MALDPKPIALTALAEGAYVGKEAPQPLVDASGLIADIIDRLEAVEGIVEGL